MNKLTGVLKEYKKRIILILKVDKELFDLVKTHVDYNMFFSFKRVNSKFKEILLSSVGDHLNKNDQQDVFNADISITVEIKEQLDKESLYLLERALSWYVCLVSDNQTYMFSIEKDSQFINARNYMNSNENPLNNM